MQKGIVLYLLIFCFLVVLVSGCLDAGGSDQSLPATPAPPAVEITVQITAIPTQTHCYFNPYTSSCQESPMTATPTTAAPTPIPTKYIDKTSAAYQNYQYDLDIISETKTSIELLTKNYKQKMVSTLGDPEEARILTSDYNEWLDYYNARIQTYQNYAARDLAEAQTGP